MNLIKRAWSGEERLWKVFWIYGALFGIILNIINGFASKFIGNTAYIPYIIYSIWLIVAQWRCAFNAEWKIWGYVVRILNVIGIIFYIVAGGLFLFTPKGSPFGSALRASSECQKELQYYEAKGGNDPKGFAKQCVERQMQPQARPAADEVIVKPSITNKTAVAAKEPEKYKTSCEQKMTDYANNKDVNPKEYIADNQDYLQKCIKYYQGKNT